MVLIPITLKPKTLTILVIIVLIPLLFYAYQLITKKAILPIDITIFYLTIIISNLVFYYIINIESLHFFYTYISVIVLFIIFGSYMVLTLLPIKNFLFNRSNNQKIWNKRTLSS